MAFPCALGDGQFSALVGQFSADKVDNLTANHRTDFEPILAQTANISMMYLFR